MNFIKNVWLKAAELIEGHPYLAIIVALIVGGVLF